MADVSGQTFLILGGTGKAGRWTVATLKSKGYSDDQIRIATRKPKADVSNHVKFDWDDESTWDAAVNGATGVLIVGPYSPNAVELMNKFSDVALKAGVKRQVLMSGLSISVDGAFWGKTHRHLADNVPEYVVLRPTHFMHNFIEGGYYDEMVKSGTFSDGYGDGKCGLVSAEDVGAAVAGALTLPSDSPLLNNIDGYQLEGPKALSFGEAGEIMSKISGKKIRYNDLDLAEMRAARPDFFPKDLVALLDYVLDYQRAGKMAPMKDQGVLKLAGREPQSFEEFCEKNKSAWDKCS